jgi:ABC-type phosphate transport system substrate-binding protein
MPDTIPNMKHFTNTLCILGIGLAMLSVSARAAEFLIVANPAISISSVSKDDFKNILLGNKSKTDGGTNIKLALMTEGPVHETVIQTFTARSVDQFDKYWKKLVFTGKNVAPDTFKSESELLAFVAKTPGAIGYVAAGTQATETKILKVE